MGNQGTSESMTSTTSASLRREAGSKPRCSGWAVGKFMYRLFIPITTGIAKDSEKATSASTASGSLPTAPVMMRGCSARAKSSATSSTWAGSGWSIPPLCCLPPGVIVISECASASISRGRERYTGPRGSAIAIASARSTTDSSCEKCFNS